jgi:hypothetical protein
MSEWQQWRIETGDVLHETIGISTASKFLTGEKQQQPCDATIDWLLVSNWTVSQQGLFSN